MNQDSCPTLQELEQLALGSAAPELTAHIAGCDACKESLAMIQTNQELLGDFVAMGIEPSKDNVPPEIVGYQISHEIHRGGQGVVYKAEQLSTKRVVAIKVPIGGTSLSAKQRWRFEREVEIAASLRHPGIVTVHEGGLASDGRPYLAMEYVEGVPIDKYFSLCYESDQRRSISKQVKTFIEVCEAVGVAHQQGILHRDLKPANILIDSDGAPRVLDFGIASVFGRDVGSVNAAAKSEFVGTLAYAAPEQLGGISADIDTRADVYALGLTLYEILTGEGARTMGTDIGVLIQQFKAWVPDKPSMHCQQCDYEIDAIVSKALALDPNKRYQSVAAFADDLVRYLNDDPVEALRGNAWYKFHKVLRKRMVPIAAVSIAAVVLIAVSIVMSLLYQQANRDAELARIDASESLAIRTFLEDTLGSVAPSRPGQDVLVRDVLDEAVHWIGIALSDQPEAAASIHLTVGNSYRSLGAYDKAEEQLQLAHALNEDTFGAHSIEFSSSLNVLALLRADQNLLDESERMLNEVLALRVDLLGAEAPSVATSHMNLARVQRSAGRLDEAEATLQRCKALRVNALGLQHADIAMCDFEIAATLHLMGKPEEAAALHRRALKTRLELLPPGHPDIIRSMTILGVLLAELGLADDAIEIFDQAWAISADGTASANSQRLLIAQSLYEIYKSRSQQAETEEWASKIIQVNRSFE